MVQKHCTFKEGKQKFVQLLTCCLLLIFQATLNQQRLLFPDFRICPLHCVLSSLCTIVTVDRHSDSRGIKLLVCVWRVALSGDYISGACVETLHNVHDSVRFLFQMINYESQPDSNSR